MVVSVVLDACVLYPVGLRDTLLNVAEAGRSSPGVVSIHHFAKLRVHHDRMSGCAHLIWPQPGG